MVRRALGMFLITMSTADQTKLDWAALVIADARLCELAVIT